LLSSEAKSREKIFLALTGARLGLVIGLVAEYGRSLRLALVWLSGIVVADVLDGILARGFACDSDRRRMMDSIVDRASIHIAFVSFLSTHPALTGFYLPIALRDIINSVGSGICLRARRVLVIGGRWHKVSSLLDAVLGAAFLWGYLPFVWLAAVGAWASNYTLLLDYLGAYSVVVDSPHREALTRLTVRNLVGIRVVLLRVRAHLAPRDASLSGHSQQLIRDSAT
jgi:phosphatidylglycerophosphate synthase